jgi:hypothetical protein
MILDIKRMMDIERLSIGHPLLLATLYLHFQPSDSSYCGGGGDYTLSWLGPQALLNRKNCKDMTDGEEGRCSSFAADEITVLIPNGPVFFILSLYQKSIAFRLIT